ncbi:MAG: extracellular solute-binding protein [Desulfuromonadales bacterium]
MKVWKVCLLSVVCFLLLGAGPALSLDHLRLATTTSTENSGLLMALLPPFEKAHNCQVDVIAVGTGKALKLGEAGDVDVVLVHAPALEEAFVAAGHGVDRRDVMYNDFVLLGPAADPAGIAGIKDVAAAMKKIAASDRAFVSRGDKSGTHYKELELWKAADISPAGKDYVEAGLGMGEVINMATELQGYTLADRGTYVAYRSKTDLKILVAGDERMFNPYGVIAVNPKKHPHVKIELATKFMDYLVSPQGQQAIAAYNKNGEPLFFIYEK